MNMPLLREDSRPSWLIGISAVVLGCALTFFSTSYFNQTKELSDRNNSVETQLRIHDLAIATLKLSVENIADAQRRTENSIAAVQQTQTQVLGKLQSLQDANDAQSVMSANIKDQFIELRKQLTDNNAETRKQIDILTDILRPLAPRGNAH